MFVKTYPKQLHLKDANVHTHSIPADLEHELFAPCTE